MSYSGWNPWCGMTLRMLTSTPSLIVWWAASDILRICPPQTRDRDRSGLSMSWTQWAAVNSINPSAYCWIIVAPHLDTDFINVLWNPLQTSISVGNECCTTREPHLFSTLFLQQFCLSPQSCSGHNLQRKRIKARLLSQNGIPVEFINFHNLQQQFR